MTEFNNPEQKLKQIEKLANKLIVDTNNMFLYNNPHLFSNLCEIKKIAGQMKEIFIIINTHDLDNIHIVSNEKGENLLFKDEKEADNYAIEEMEEGIVVQIR